MPDSFDFKVAASHVVRFYLWDQLKTHLGSHWKENPVKGITIPIVPAQQQPELQTSERPYMVYSYDVMPTGDMWHLQGESIMFVIYSQSPATIAATTKLISRLFNKKDETARDINRWIGSAAPEAMMPAEFLDEIRNYKFQTVSVSGITGVQPTQSEGGRVDAAATIDILFTEKNMSLG